MLFKYLESLKNNINEEEFKEILKITADDIKFNRIGNSNAIIWGGRNEYLGKKSK